MPPSSIFSCIGRTFSSSIFSCLPKVARSGMPHSPKSLLFSWIFSNPLSVICKSVKSGLIAARRLFLLRRKMKTPRSMIIATPAIVPIAIPAVSPRLRPVDDVVDTATFCGSSAIVEDIAPIAVFEVVVMGVVVVAAVLTEDLVVNVL